MKPDLRSVLRENLGRLTALGICLALLPAAAGCRAMAVRKHQRNKPPAGSSAVRYLETHCIHCHGKKGSPYALLGGKALDDPARMRQLGYDYLFTIIRDGGPAVGRASSMPAWDRILSDSEIDLIVRQLMETGIPPALLEE